MKDQYTDVTLSDRTTSVKAELKNAKDTYDEKHNALKTTISTIISDDQFDAETEGDRLNQAFADYNESLAKFKKATQKATDAIAEAKKDLAIDKSNAYTDAQIKVTKDNINMSMSTLETTVASHTTQINNKADLSVVNQKIDGIQVGGVNLYRNTKVINKSDWYNKDNWGLDVDYNKFNVFTRTGAWMGLSQDIDFELGETYTLSVYAKTLDNATLQFYSEGNRSNTVKNFNDNSLTLEWQRFWVTFTVGENFSRPRFENSVSGATLQLYAFKMEKGTKATDWSPAPEDTEALIDTKANIIDVYNKTEVYTKAQTDSQINIAKDAINLGVSQTYETKINVESKVVTTLNNAKSYADTKKQEAINSASSDATTKANNAKNEAINSANATLNSTIANYYTKSQTDSQIKIAKDSITQSVSSTYETKAEVTNKINAIQVGGVNHLKRSREYLSPYWNNKGVTLTDDYYMDSRVYKVNKIWGALSYIKNTELGLEPNTEYTLSVYMKKDSDISYESGANMTWYGMSNITVTTLDNLTTEWKQYSVIKKGKEIMERGDGAGARIEPNKDITGGYVYVCGFKLEKGNKATDWSPAPEDMETTVSNLTNRVSTAESKITDTAITNVVKQNFYTKTETDNQITNKGYQTSSQVQQTVDALQLKFTQSGGYNMLKNGKASLSTAFWASNGGGISRVSDSVYKTCFKTTLPSGMKYTGGDNGGSIRLKNSTHYVYEAMIWSSVVINGSSNTPLHFWCNTTAETSGQAQCTVIDYCQSVPTVNTWIKCYVHFQTKASGEVWFKPIIYASGIEGNIWVTELSLSESLVQTPYSPHPSEIYDGITTIDKDGIKVATTQGAYTHFSSEGMNSYDNNGNQTLGIRNGGLTFHAWNNHEYIGYISQSAIESSGANGISIGMTSLGEFISLGVSTRGADVNAGFSQSHRFVVASTDVASANIKQGLNAFQNLHMNKWNIFDINNAYFGEGKESIIWESSSTNKLQVHGSNGVGLGYKDGDTYKSVIQCNKALDNHDCRITLFSNLNLNTYRIKNGAIYYDNYGRGGGDYTTIFKTDTSSESQINVEIANDYPASFNIQTYNWKDYGRHIARFRYEAGTSASSKGIDFYRMLDMHNYNIINVGNLGVYSLQSEDLEVNDIRIATPFAVMSRSGRQTSLSVVKSVDDVTEVNGTAIITGGRAKVNLPEGLIFTEYFVQITANKLAKIAITEKGDDYFIIMTDLDEDIEVFYTIKAFQPKYIARASVYGELQGDAGDSAITYAESIEREVAMATPSLTQIRSDGDEAHT